MLYAVIAGKQAQFVCHCDVVELSYIPFPGYRLRIADVVVECASAYHHLAGREKLPASVVFIVVEQLCGDAQTPLAR